MTGTDAIVEHILATYDTITVVGASASDAKAAHSVPAYMQRLGWRIIPVNPHADQILGEQVYRRLGDIPEQVGLVDVFRPPWQAPDIARQAVTAGATALWLQRCPEWTGCQIRTTRGVFTEHREGLTERG